MSKALELIARTRVALDDGKIAWSAEEVQALLDLVDDDLYGHARRYIDGVGETGDVCRVVTIVSPTKARPQAMIGKTSMSIEPTLENADRLFRIVADDAAAIWVMGPDGGADALKTAKAGAESVKED